MSISMDHFGSVGRWRGGRDLLVDAWPLGQAVSFVECHYCGFGHSGVERELTRCPKCGGSAWERCTTHRGALPPIEGRSAVLSDIGHALAARRHPAA